MLGWLGNIDPDEFYYAQHHTGGTNNFQKYSNPQVDQLLDQARTETDQDARKQIYDQAAKLIVDDASYLYLYNPDVVQGWSPRSTGYKVRADRAIRFDDVATAAEAAAWDASSCAAPVQSVGGAARGEPRRLRCCCTSSPATRCGWRWAPGSTRRPTTRCASASGLDRPLVVQYFSYIGHALTGDLGVSFRSGAAGDLDRAGAAARHAVAGLRPRCWSRCSSPSRWASLSAVRSGSLDRPRRHGVQPVRRLGARTSGWASCCILLFAGVLGWLPPSGYVRADRGPVAGWASHWSCRRSQSAWSPRSILTRFIRSCGAGGARPRTTCARPRPRGSRRVVLGWHVLRNALIPVVTVVGGAAGLACSAG